MPSPSVYLIPFLLLLSSSLLSLTTAQFNNAQQTTSTTTSSTSTTSTSTAPTATSTDQYGSCVDACINTSPIINYCNGTETGSALDQCKCKSYTPSNDPLINCINGCPSDQQYNFADTLPKLCAQTLFLGLNLTDQPKPNAENTAASATFGAAAATGTPSGNDGVGFEAGVHGLRLIALAVGVAVFL